MKTPRAYSGGRRRAVKAPRPAPLRESHVEQTVTEFMEWDGWRSFKMEAQSDHSLVKRFMTRVYAHDLLKPLAQIIHYVLRQVMRGTGVGEPAMPDRIFIRYRHQPSDGDIVDEYLHRGTADVVWIEFKRPGQKPRADQIAWHQAERERGGMVYVVGETDDWWDIFRAWYAASGLQRVPQR